MNLELRAKEDRYNRAYGANLFSLERLAEYLTPIRNEITSLEDQMEPMTLQTTLNEPMLPHLDEIESFATEAAEELSNLNFEQKRAIVMSVVEKAIGTKEELRVYGHIPVNGNNYVKQQVIDRHRWITQCGQIYAL